MPAGGTCTATVWWAGVAQVVCHRAVHSSVLCGLPAAPGPEDPDALCPLGTSWEASDWCQDPRPSTDVLSALVFPPYLPANRALAHKAPCVPASLLSPFPALYFMMQGLWRGNSLESLFCAQKSVFHPIYSSCSSHLIFPRSLIPGVTRRAQLLVGDRLSVALPLLLSTREVPLCVYLLISEKDFSISGLMSDAIDLE